MTDDELLADDGDVLPDRLAMSLIDPSPAHPGLPAVAADGAWDHVPLYSIQQEPAEPSDAV